jgi:hypothetical protein
VKTLLVAAAVALLASAVIGDAAVPDATGTIHACRKVSGRQIGALRVIDTDAGQGCTAKEAPLAWSQGLASSLEKQQAATSDPNNPGVVTLTISPTTQYMVTTQFNVWNIDGAQPPFLVQCAVTARGATGDTISIGNPAWLRVTTSDSNQPAGTLSVNGLLGLFRSESWTSISATCVPFNVSTTIQFAATIDAVPVPTVQYQSSSAND